MTSERKKCNWFKPKSSNPNECMHYRPNIDEMCDSLGAQIGILPNEEENIFN